MNWKKTKLSGDPVLVMGLRGEKGAIEGYRINLDKDVHPELVRVAKDTLEWLNGLDAVDYTPYVEQESGEYLALATDSLQSEEGKADGVGTEKQEAATIVRMVRDSDELEEMGAGELIKRLGDDFYLQAICLRDGKDKIGFVTKARRQQVMKRSVIPLGKNDKNDRLKKITLPELVLESDVHAVIGPEEVAILNRTQFQFMVSDTALISSHVPIQVERIVKTFKGRGIKITDSTRAALLASAMGSVRVAKRLDAFAERAKALDVSLISSGAGFKSQELAPDDFVNTEGEIACEPDRVAELLDALEGRFFGDAFSTEKRRADRFRPR